MNQHIAFTEKENRIMAEKMDKAADVLHNASKRYPDHRIAMQSFLISQRKVQDPEQCETVACMAGFYYLGKTTNPVFIKDKVQNTSYLSGDFSHYAGYEEGMTMFARDLGFNDKTELYTWAEEHPAIWGNRYGGNLFSVQNAYNVPANEYLTMEIVVAHLHNVAERLRDPNKRLNLASEE